MSGGCGAAFRPNNTIFHICIWICMCIWVHLPLCAIFCYNFGSTCHVCYSLLSVACFCLSPTASCFCFYKNLSEPGIRETYGIATTKINLAAWLKGNKKSRASIAKAAGVAASTVSAASLRHPIQEAKAEAIAQAMGKRLGEVFTVEHDMEPLSDRTVLAYHRLISIILAQAEKEMLVPYNTAAKATPPKAAKKPPTTSSRKQFPKY